MVDKPNPSVFQTHQGSGNNFAGSSYDLRGSNFHTGLMPDKLEEAMRMILDDIAGFRLDDARKSLAGLQLVSFGVQDSHDLITVLTNLCDVVDGRYNNIDSQMLRRIAFNVSNDNLADLALSVLLRLQVRRDDLPGAKDRYNSAPRRGEYSRAIYFECLCGSEEELQRVFTTDKYALSHTELIGIATGLLRFSNGEQAADVAGFIHEENPGDYNSAVLRLLAKATQINSRIAARCYWLLPQCEKDAVVKLIQDTLDLSEVTGGHDRRLYNILLPVFDYVQADAPALKDFCLAHIEMIDTLDAEFVTRLRAVFDTEKSENTVTPCQRMAKVWVKNNEQITEDDFFLHVRSGYINELKEWTRLGGRVLRSKGSLSDAVFDVIECIFVTQTSTETLKNSVDTLNSRHDFGDLNPHFMRVLAKEMLQLKRPFEAASLLEKVVGNTTEVWCSPLMDTLCEALYDANQYRKLERIASIISHPDRTEFFYRLNIDSCLKHNNLEGAFVLIKEGLNLHPESISLQFSQLVYLKLSANRAALSEAISAFDLNFLNVPSEHNFSAMHFLLEHGRSEDVQDILVRWFVSDPDKYARIVSQFCLNTLLGKRHPTPQIAYASGDCQCGVVYEVNGDTVTRIICSPRNAAHSVLLPEDTPLARELLKMKPGEESQVQMRKIRLLERIPSYVAVFRQSLELRKKAFDGADVFYSFSIPDASEDIGAVLLENIPLPHFDHDLMGNINIPLSLRAYKNQPEDPVSACLQALTDKRFSKASFYNTGKDGGDSLFTDLITLVYLAITSLTNYFVQKNITLYVSPYTLSLIDEWINCVEIGEYRKLGVTDDHRINILNSEAVMNDRSGVYHNLKKIRPAIKPLSPATGDLPWSFCIIKDVLHPVSLAEYYAVSAGVPPYFSIDSVSASYVQFSCGDVVCNTQRLLIEAAKFLPYVEREGGIVLHITTGLPVPLILSDISNIASSHRLAEPEWLCRFLSILTTTLPAGVNVYELLASVYMLCVQKIAKQSIFIPATDLFLTAESHPYSAGFDRVMYACCNYLLRIPATCTAEDKLINLALTFLSRGNDRNLFARKFWPYMQLFMQGRFISSAMVSNEINCIWREVQRRVSDNK